MHDCPRRKHRGKIMRNWKCKFLLSFVCFNAVMSQVLEQESCFVRAKKHQVAQFNKESEGAWSGPYIFIFAADPQPGLINQVYEEGDGGNWDAEVELMNQAVAAVNRMNPQPRFIFLGGDILNAFPGQRHREAQYASVQNCFSKTNKNIPILVASGNHDVGNIPTNDTRDIYNAEFGDEYYSFWVGGVFYIVIDSQYLYDDSLTPERSAAQQEWFNNILEEARDSGSKHTVLFTHIPLFINHVDEEDNYFAIKQNQRREILEKLAEAGIKLVFHGHYHRQAGGSWTTQVNGTDHTIKVVVSSAIGCQLGDQESGINVVQVSESEITHAYYPMKSIPEHVNIT